MTRRRLALAAGLALAIAGKYAEALPLARAMVASLEKTSNNRDLAGEG
ncbi:hypothetical protein [Bradyrhizobium sp. UNPF46]|nr:hypothetical protein [Bradyrhizobium sp. UNPF46]